MIRDNTEIIYDFESTTACVEGVVDCQIRLYGTNRELITAPKFTIVVDERVVGDDDFEVDDDTLSAFDQIFLTENERISAEEDRVEAEEARAEAEEAREAAEAERKSIWIKYSAYSNGKIATDRWYPNQNYIGIAAAHDCPTDPRGFVWVLFKGNKGDKGEKGDPFSITKSYSSIAQMNADFLNVAVPTGSFVMIDTDNPNNTDNGKLYVKGETGFKFITDLIGAVGLKGEQGAPGNDGISASHYWEGTTLTVTSASGTSSADLKGDKGDRGYSAYEIARINGYVGLAEEWIESLKGTNGSDGLSAYAIAQAHGFQGSEEDWLNSIKGIDGEDGLSAYEIAKLNGYTGTEAEWLASLKGRNGKNGTDGASAYEVARANGYSGSQSDWLNSLKGTDGINGLSAYEVAKRNGYTGTEIEWLLSLKGNNGTNGKSNYEIACENGFDGDEIDWLNSMRGTNGLSAYEVAKLNGYTGTEEEWLESLKGRNGKNGSNGSNGDSAYEIAVANGFEGTPAEWLESLKGTNGKDGNSAYAIARLNGFNGTVEEWLDSLNGVSAEHHWEGTTLTVTSASGTSSEDLKGEEGKSAYQSACDNGFKGTEAEWLDYLNGTTKHIITTDGSLLRVFVGTQAQYDATEDKNNLFAVITDDEDGDKFDAVVKATLPTEGLAYRLSDDGSYYICTGIGTAEAMYGILKDLRIPSEYNGLPVREIGDKAFDECYYLETVTIPNSVTSLGWQAFGHCENLTSVDIGNGVTTIGKQAFSVCKKLCNVTLGNSITSIEPWAFSNCESLTKVNIPNSVTSIGSGAFSSCENLKCINIPKNVTRIGEAAFIYCSKVIIYCEATSQPNTWDSYWRTLLGSATPFGDVVWGKTAPDVVEAARADIATTANSADHATTADSADVAMSLDWQEEWVTQDEVTGSTLNTSFAIGRPIVVEIRPKSGDAFENVVVHTGNSSRSANGYYCYRAIGGTVETRYIQFYDSSGQLFTPYEVRMVEL
jgi:hypothetical protein